MDKTDFSPVSDSYPEPRGKKTARKYLGIDVQEAVAESFRRVGGAKYLERIAQTDPKTYCALLAKLMPSKVEADGNAVIVALQELTDEQLERRLAQSLAAAERMALPTAGPTLPAEVVSVEPVAPRAEREAEEGQEGRGASAEEEGRGGRPRRGRLAPGLARWVAANRGRRGEASPE